MKAIAELLTPERIVDLSQQDKNAILARLADVAATHPAVHDRDELLEKILAREQLMSTGIGIGLAVPHARLDSVDEFVIALGRSREGIEYGALDGQPVHLVFLIAAPEVAREEYLRLLARITLHLKDPECFKRVLEAPTAADVQALLSEE
jgi:mannitol/fructose-specific phosphotransferase system IIA component (Ntr-type)